LGNNLDKGTGVGKGSGNGVGTGVGKGSGNGVGNEIGNKQKPENTPVATATKPPKENGSTLNRADCIQCKIKYPDSARRRGAEGNPEVSINTDLNGNVTQVRLIRSSGDRELDEAAQKAAQEWKLTPTEGGREGVKASVNFAIKGTQRHRQLQERQTKKEREVAKKKPEKETFTSNSVESSQGNQRKITPIITDVPTENTIRRNPESAPSESKSSTESNSDL
jgi:TonB family protein